MLKEWTLSIWYFLIHIQLDHWFNPLSDCFWSNYLLSINSIPLSTSISYHIHSFITVHHSLPFLKPDHDIPNNLDHHIIWFPSIEFINSHWICPINLTNISLISVSVCYTVLSYSYYIFQKNQKSITNSMIFCLWNYQYSFLFLIKQIDYHSIIAILPSSYSECNPKYIIINLSHQFHPSISKSIWIGPLSNTLLIYSINFIPLSDYQLSIGSIFVFLVHKTILYWYFCLFIGFVIFIFSVHNCLLFH